MNKSDVRLIVILLLVSGVCFSFYFFMFNGNNNHALVYYDGNLVMTIDLNVDGDYYTEGFNGLVYMNVRDGKIRVNEENSPYHICSKQGYISKSYESIVCLPNKVVINIDDSIYDAVVK